MKEEVTVKGEKFVHITHAARAFGVSLATMRVGCQDKKMECVQIGGAWYIQRTSFRAFMRHLQERKTEKSIKVQVKRKAEFEVAQPKPTLVRRIFKMGGEIRRKK